jgi:hypothetical protein
MQDTLESTKVRSPGWQHRVSLKTVIWQWLNVQRWMLGHFWNTYCLFVRVTTYLPKQYPPNKMVSQLCL